MSKHTLLELCLFSFLMDEYKLGFIGEFKKLVCENEELPQSTSLTAPCRREPWNYFNLNGKIPLFYSNTIDFANFFAAKLTLASLRQGGGIFVRKWRREFLIQWKLLSCGTGGWYPPLRSSANRVRQIGIYGDVSKLVCVSKRNSLSQLRWQLPGEGSLL